MFNICLCFLCFGFLHVKQGPFPCLNTHPQYREVLCQEVNPLVVELVGVLPVVDGAHAQVELAQLQAHVRQVQAQPLVGPGVVPGAAQDEDASVLRDGYG